jgi:hypothetical protein
LGRCLRWSWRRSPSIKYDVMAHALEMSAADRQTLVGANDMFTSLGVRDHAGAQLKFEAGMRENAELREQVGKLTAELAKACKQRDQFRDALNQKRGKHVCGK